jgi:hypothetical protein
MILFGGFKMTANFNSAPMLNYRQVRMLIGPACPTVAACWDTIVTSSPEPRARKGHAAVYDPNGDRMILFGGQLQGQTNPADGPTSDETWQMVFSNVAQPVTSLSRQSSTSQTATLNWFSTNPIDNPVGVCGWDLRSSASPISTDAAFETATPITSPITKAPSGGGWLYSTTFTVAQPTSFRYYALRSTLPSQISNELCFRVSPYTPCMEELRTDLDEPTPTSRLSLSVPNPGDRRFECALTVPGTESATLTVHDVAGRSVERHTVEAGNRSVGIGESTPLRPGFYMVVLRQGANESRRSVIVR